MQDTRDPLNFDDFVFRVCPLLSYRHRNELNVHKSRIEKGEGGQGSNDNGLALLVQREESEREQNERVLGSVIAGEEKRAIKYYRPSHTYCVVTLTKLH